MAVTATQLGYAAIKIVADSAGLTAQIETAKKKTETLGSSGAKSGMALTAAYAAAAAAVAAVVAETTRAINISNESANIQARLGAVAQESVGAVNAFADAQLKLLGIDDEVTASMAAQIAALTKLSGESLIEATRAAQQWAALSGKSFEAAAQDVTKYISNGTVMGFQRYGLAIKDTGTELGNLQEITSQVASGQSILEAKAATSAGMMEKLKQTVENMEQSFGDGITQSDSFKNALQALTDEANRLIESGQLEQIGKDVAILIEFFANLAIVVERTLFMFGELAKRGNPLYALADTFGLLVDTQVKLTERTQEWANQHGIASGFAKQTAGAMSEIAETTGDAADAQEALSKEVEDMWQRAIAGQDDYFKQRADKAAEERKRIQEAFAEMDKWIAERVKHEESALGLLENESAIVKELAFQLFPVLALHAEKIKREHVAIDDRLRDWLDLYHRNFDALVGIVEAARSGNTEAQKWVAHNREAVTLLDAQLTAEFAKLTPLEQANEKLQNTLRYQATITDLSRATSENVTGIAQQWSEVNREIEYAVTGVGRMTAITGLIGATGNDRVDALIRQMAIGMGYDPFGAPGRTFATGQAGLAFFGQQYFLGQQAGRLNRGYGFTGQQEPDTPFNSIAELLAEVRNAGMSGGRSAVLPNRRTPVGSADDPLYIRQASGDGGDGVLMAMGIA